MQVHQSATMTLMKPEAIVMPPCLHALQKLKGGDHSKIGVKPLPQGALFLKE